MTFTGSLVELTQHSLGTQERAWEPQEGGWGSGDWGWEPWDWVWGSGEVAWGRGWGSSEGLFPGEAGALPGPGCFYILGCLGFLHHPCLLFTLHTCSPGTNTVRQTLYCVRGNIFPEETELALDLSREIVESMVERQQILPPWIELGVKHVILPDCN